MARPSKQYRIKVRGQQRTDIDADLLVQALLLMAEEKQGDSRENSPDETPLDGRQLGDRQ